jgi:preprotein translocase subunit SecG
MVIVLTIIHVIVCFFLIMVVLVQQGKSADLAGAFGGMGSQTAFGPRGTATALSKATTAAAVIFMITSIALAVLAGKTTNKGSVLERTGQGTTQSQPAQPAQQNPASPVPAQQTPAQQNPAQNPTQQGGPQQPPK